MCIHEFKLLAIPNGPMGGTFFYLCAVFSQGQSTGAHLQLKGEESWGFTEDVMNHSGVGMGALKMSDVASTIVTIPLGEQVLMEENKIPVSMNFLCGINCRNFRLYV